VQGVLALVAAGFVARARVAVPGRARAAWET
jgi:hypothetical protein